MKPLISVITPVYNVEKYLTKCIESILNQTLSNIEIIAIDDGSSDDSGRILDEFAKVDKRLMVIHTENRGVSEARNEGLKHVRGEFIGFVDSDDWIDTEMYEFMYKYAIEKSIDIVMCAYIREFINHSKVKNMGIEDGKIIGKFEIHNNFLRKMIGPLSGEAFITENLDMHSVIWNKIYRTSLLKNIYFDSLKDIGSCEDLLFNLKAFYRAEKVLYIDRPYYHYRKIIQSSVSSSYRPNLFQQRINLIEKLRSFIIQYKCDQSYYEALNNRTCLGLMGLGLNIVSPSNDSNFFMKLQQIREKLSSSYFTNSFQSFDDSNMPIHWRLFYSFARNRNTICYYFMLKIISKMIVIAR